MCSKIPQRSHSFLYNLASQLNEYGPSGLEPEEIQGAPPPEGSFGFIMVFWWRVADSCLWLSQFQKSWLNPSAASYLKRCSWIQRQNSVLCMWYPLALLGEEVLRVWRVLYFVCSTHWLLWETQLPSCLSCVSSCSNQISYYWIFPVLPKIV